MYKILLILGSRPELIKMAPLIFEMSKRGMRDSLLVVNCSQQPQMQSTFEFLGITPDHNVQVHPDSDANHAAAQCLSGLQEMLGLMSPETEKTALVMALGDGTASFAAALTAFHNHLPFVHLEAGLRTHNLQYPFPQEFYRRVMSMVASLHFVPTVPAYYNLVKEGVDENRIILSGNTVVDAIEHIKQLSQFKLLPALPDKLLYDFRSRKLVLVTFQRPENRQQNLDKIIEVSRDLARQYKDYTFIWVRPQEKNADAPELKELCANDNVFMVDNLDYPDLMRLYPHLKLIITDSGGIQEEAPSFKVPVLMLRESTEKKESIERGYAFLCGVNSDKIKRYFEFCANHPIDITHNPYGDGKAAERITDFMVKYLQLNLHTEPVGQSFTAVF